MRNKTLCFGVAGGCGLAAFAMLITVLASIHVLGPEDQLLIKYPEGWRVKNGPWSGVIITHHEKVLRNGTLLQVNQFAVIKNRLTAEARHELGPQLLFLGPYDNLVSVQGKVVLKEGQYVEVKDGLSGKLRHEVGPLVFQQGLHDEVSEVRQDLLLEKNQYAIIKDTLTGVVRHVSGPQLLHLQVHDELLDQKEKLIVEQKQYIVIKDKLNGTIRHVVGPLLLQPGVQDEVVGLRDMVVLESSQYVVVKDRITGEPRHEAGPQLFHPGHYDEVLEVKEKLILERSKYAVVKDRLSGERRHELGQQLFLPRVHDEVLQVLDKLILEKDEYVRLVNTVTGAERVVRGQQTIVPEPTESSVEGKQKVIFLDRDSAVLLLDRVSGQQRLVAERGAFAPGAYEQVLEVRSRIHILPHEAVVVRDASGQLSVVSGAENRSTSGTSFFLEPHAELFSMTWSGYSSLPKDNSPQVATEERVEKIDLRARKIFFRYEVRTSDNVKLSLEGTIFWQMQNVSRMLMATADPQGDVWHHARNAMIQAVSNSTLESFMSGFNKIIQDSFLAEARSDFYADRGVELQSMELTRFDCTDEETAQILQQIIQETTNKINRLTMQESENDVKAAALTADIDLERRRTELIRMQAENERLQAEMRGVASGVQLAKSASGFIEGLVSVVPNVSTRVGLYKMHEELQSRNQDTFNLASGKAQLFLTPANVNLRLDNTAGGTEL